MVFRITRHPVGVGQFGQGVLLLLLVYLWILNLADFLLTRHALWSGLAEESNWIMDYFFQQGTVPAMAFKVGIVTIGVLLLWRLRRFRESLIAAAMLTVLFALVVFYEAASLMTI
ncbi:MAG: DUF5658 family protein [Thermoleophilia bacterium]